MKGTLRNVKLAVNSYNGYADVKRYGMGYKYPDNVKLMGKTSDYDKPKSYALGYKNQPNVNLEMKVSGEGNKKVIVAPSEDPNKHLEHPKPPVAPKAEDESTESKGE